MQRGHAYRAIRAWHLRHRVHGKQVSVKLADYTDEYRTLKNVRPLSGALSSNSQFGPTDRCVPHLQQYAQTVPLYMWGCWQRDLYVPGRIVRSSLPL